MSLAKLVMMEMTLKAKEPENEKWSELHAHHSKNRYSIRLSHTNDLLDPLSSDFMLMFPFSCFSS